MGLLTLAAAGAALALRDSVRGYLQRDCAEAHKHGDAARELVAELDEGSIDGTVD